MRSFQISAVFPHLTVLENVRIALQRTLGTSFHFWRSETSPGRSSMTRALELLEAGRPGRIRQRMVAVELPYGRKRALEIATTLALDPELMLLDEPTRAWATRTSTASPQLIKQAAAKRTVLMVEHNMNVVADLCDRITVLPRGAVLAEGAYAAVSKNPQVIEAYMGTGHADTARGGAIVAGALMLRVEDLQAWYGESHILHGVDFDGRAAAKWSRCSAATAPASTTTMSAIMGLVGQAQRLGASSTAARRSACRRTHRPAGHRLSARKSAASSRALNVEENLLLPPEVRRRRRRRVDAYYAHVPQPEGALA